MGFGAINVALWIQRILTLLSVTHPQLTTLRGSVLEDAVPSTSKHGTTRGLPVKDVLEYLLPELDLSCLRLALNTPKVTEQLMKLDEQGVGSPRDPPRTFLRRPLMPEVFFAVAQLSFQVKVGVMYCRAGQSTEEEMYNNETAGPALEEFLQLLGDKVRLKGFTKYRAQLDTKSKNQQQPTFFLEHTHTRTLL